jgi:hypothetical protein
LDEASYLRSVINGKRKSKSIEMTPAEIVAYWQANNLLTGYGDPEKDSADVARELRERFSRRDRNRPTNHELVG